MSPLPLWDDGRLAFDPHLPNQTAKHPFHLNGVATDLVQVRVLQEPKIAQQKQIILKFTGGSQRLPEEAAEVAVTCPAAAFRNIGRHRYRCAQHS